MKEDYLNEYKNSLPADVQRYFEQGFQAGRLKMLQGEAFELGYKKGQEDIMKDFKTGYVGERSRVAYQQGVAEEREKFIADLQSIIDSHKRYEFAPPNFIIELIKKYKS